MRGYRLPIAIIVLILLGLVGTGGSFVFAQNVGQINELKDTIDTKKESIDQISKKISQYQKVIEEKQGEVASLDEELELLSNRIAKSELDIKATEEKIESSNAEITLLEAQIDEFEIELNVEKNLLIDLLQEIDMQDNAMKLRILFGTESFSDIFDELQQLADVNSDLQESVNRIKNAKEVLVVSSNEEQAKREQLLDLQDEIKRNRQTLESQIGAKESIINETQHSEAQYRTLLTELRQEQSYINHQIGQIQAELEAKLRDVDSEGGSTVLSWPAVRPYGISAYFHDPTYPYRHLFEHSGLDIPLNHGTPLKAAAPGYVAWARTGRQYGNYVMIIHANGVATLYAHMSRMDVQADQFVARGQQIGLSGGTPGTQGAGLSTGAHVHFEVRENGVPVNPLDYLAN